VTVQTVLLPLFVQVGLTFVLLFWMAGVRTSSIRSREVHMRDIALREPNWPSPVQQVANAFHNQLEVPVLFYVLTILAWITRKADLLFVIMAWLFVLSRIVHAYIHVTDNRVSRRGMAFGVGVLVLFLMWVIFALRLLLELW
jgi:hypothetical protein